MRTHVLRLAQKRRASANFSSAAIEAAKERLLRDVPQPVLLELLATGLFVIRNCILNLPNMQKIRRHPLYIFGADLHLSPNSLNKMSVRSRFVRFGFSIKSCATWNKKLSAGPLFVNTLRALSKN
jgi:hypothetical protein